MDRDRPPAVIQCFTTGVDDHLAIATDPAALRAAGLAHVDTDGADARGTVLVSRAPVVGDYGAAAQ